MRWRAVSGGKPVSAARAPASACWSLTTTSGLNAATAFLLPDYTLVIDHSGLALASPHADGC